MVTNQITVAVVKNGHITIPLYRHFPIQTKAFPSSLAALSKHIEKSTLIQIYIEMLRKHHQPMAILVRTFEENLKGMVPFSCMPCSCKL